MTKKQVIKLCKIYQEHFSDSGIEPIKEGKKSGRILNHLMWMTIEIPKLVEEDKMEKVFRWLGFLQGALWANGAFTLEELKNHNR